MEEAAEEGGSLGLVVLGGVVVLLLEGGGEFEGDGEVHAGFADGFEVTIELGGAGAVAVAEHASVFNSEVVHVGAFGV